MSGGVHRATLSSSRALARDVVEYAFALSDEDAALTWRPGQFISLTCGVKDDGHPILRSYSIANRPGSGRVDLVVKLVDGPGSAWFRQLGVGTEVRFTGPMGFFVLDLHPHPGDVVFAATGTGIAPIVPMVADTLARAEAGRVHLYWGVRCEEDLFWRDEIARLASPRLSTVVTLSQPSPAWAGERGRITDRVLALAPSLAHPTFYLCGNGAMIKEVKAALVQRGVDRKKQIRTEAFFD